MNMILWNRVLIQFVIPIRHDYRSTVHLIIGKCFFFYIFYVGERLIV